MAPFGLYDSLQTPEHRTFHAGGSLQAMESAKHLQSHMPACHELQARLEVGSQQQLKAGYTFSPLGSYKAQQALCITCDYHHLLCNADIINMLQPSPAWSTYRKSELHSVLGHRLHTCLICYYPSCCISQSVPFSQYFLC